MHCDGNKVAGAEQCAKSRPHRQFSRAFWRGAELRGPANCDLMEVRPLGIADSVTTTPGL